ncbi:uncharacterized protein LOC115068295, partial [Nannospalax galili]|uniref:uncharacterized protein LOC115068295 n=1 Tax=Nannospalax galili TaxID=1026970 RepID=UPI00111C6781
MVDTGAQNSVLLEPRGPVSSKTTWVQGATGTKPYSWTTQRTVDLGKGRVSHSFLVIPECPYPLMGRDLLSKMRAQIYFTAKGATLLHDGALIQVLVTNDLTEEYRLHQEPIQPNPEIAEWLQRFPQAWAETEGMGLVGHRPPIYVELKVGVDPVKVCQYSMPVEAKCGITPHIRRLVELGILRPIQSAWNTPLLPVKKPQTGDYRPVQDLREVNKRVIDIHPTVPNSYTLLSTLPPDRPWYTVLDLKDAFFSLPLAPSSQPYFAFEGHDPEAGINGQLTWTRLPQGFKNSPTIFDEALHEDLGEYRAQHPNISLLQYVDDLLVTAPDQKSCLKDPDLGDPLHDCTEILAQVHCIRPDLKDVPLPDAKETWYTDGSSFIRNDQEVLLSYLSSLSPSLRFKRTPAIVALTLATLISTGVAAG